MADTSQDREKAYFEGEFRGSPQAETQYRIANALEYIAYQMGEMRRQQTETNVRLNQVIAALNRQQSRGSSYR